MYIHPAIHLGLILLRCESLDGFREVLVRAKKGEASARSELEFAAGLVRIGLNPSLEPQLGAKKLDTRFVFDEQEVFCEVIAPERSDAMEDAEAQITAMARRLVQDNPDTEIEVLLSPSFDFAKSKDLEDSIWLTDVGLKRHEVPEAGAFIKFAAPLVPVVIPRLMAEAPGPVLGTAHMMNNTGNITQAVVRLPSGDWRAERLLTAELHHFSKDRMNLLAIDVSQVPGGMKEWVDPLQRRFQPTRNRRIGAVVLYEKSGLVGPTSKIWPRWRVLRNPHAYVPAPQSLLDAIGTLDSGPIPSAQ